MHVAFEDYHVSDAEFVAAFDVDDKEGRQDLSEAINASENNTIKICEVPTSGVEVQRGHTLDGLGKYYRQTIEESAADPVDVVQTPPDVEADVLVSTCRWAPEEADKFYAQCAIDAGVAFVNALRSSSPPTPEWAKKFEDAGVPIVGDDISRRSARPSPPRDREAVRGPRRPAGPHLPAQRRRQHGLQEHARARAPGVEEGLSQDPGRHLQPDRPRWPASRSTTSNVPSARPDYVAWLDDRKWAYVRLEGTTFGEVPLNLEFQLEVWDSPNSAGIIIDAIRAAKIAKDRGIGGPDHLGVVVPDEVPAGLPDGRAAAASRPSSGRGDPALMDLR